MFFCYLGSEKKISWSRSNYLLEVYVFAQDMAISLKYGITFCTLANP